MSPINLIFPYISASLCPSLMNKFLPVILLASILVAGGCQSAKTVAMVTPVSTVSKSSKSDSDLKAYSDVITKDAFSDEGLFATNQKDGKVYFEIPDSLFGRDMLPVNRVDDILDVE